jgi:hypothetical protein
MAIRQRVAFFITEYYARPITHAYNYVLQKKDLPFMQFFF